MPDNSKSVQFWNRPEGTTGKAIIGAGIAVALVGLYKALPYIITLAQNTLYAMFLLGLIGLILYLPTTDWFQSRAYYVLQMISRAITSNFVDIDPVAILKAFIRKMKQKYDEIEASIKKIFGVNSRLEQEIRRRQKKLQELSKEASAAEATGNTEAYNTIAEMAGGIQQDIEELQEQKKVIEDMLAQLERVRERAKWRVTQGESDLERLITKNQLAEEIGGAVDSANSVLSESGDLFEIKNMAADRIKEKYSAAIGELEGLSYLTRDLGKQIDMGKLTMQADGKAILDKLKVQMMVAEGNEPTRALTAGTGGFTGITPKATATVVAELPEDKWARKIKRRDA